MILETASKHNSLSKTTSPSLHQTSHPILLKVPGQGSGVIRYNNQVKKSAPQIAITSGYQQLKELASQRPKQRNFRHKTNFKIKRTLTNVVQKNLVLTSDEKVFIPEYDKIAPFFPDKMDFVDDAMPHMCSYKEKYGYRKANLAKNRLTLEDVMLHRLLARQTKLKEKKKSKSSTKKEA